MGNRWYIGIDPGSTGAYAQICEDEDMQEYAYDFTTMQNAYHDIFRWVHNAPDKVVLAVLEKVQPMPKSKTSSITMFKLGSNYGFWQGILTSLRIPFRIIPPKEWQRGLIFKSDGADTKTRSLVAAQRLFPDVDLSKKKDHNRADALLIAYYARGLKL